MYNFKILFSRLKELIKRVITPKSRLTKDIIYLLNSLQSEKPIIFDVGAFKGHWISPYLERFPHCKAYLFEPYLESYKALQRRFFKLDNIYTFRLALSDKKGTSNIKINEKAYTNSLLELHESASQSWENESLKSISLQSITTNTIDYFADQYNIKKINLLKLDVQGLEYLVLKGASKLLAKSQIDILLLEVIVIPTYRKQSKVSHIFNILDSNDYKLYGIYDVHRLTKSRKIQQFDAVFLSSKFYNYI